ncbi:MAG: hypothetical protein ACJ76H_03125 [Bacteriovoracaceae bacterium]
MRALLCLSFVLFSFLTFAQEDRLEDIPMAQDDRDSEIVLKHMIKEAHWLDQIKIRVNYGVVYISGTYMDMNHIDLFFYS